MPEEQSKPKPEKPDYVWRAEAAKAQAEAEKAKAEGEAAAAMAKKTSHEATEASSSAAKAQIALEREEEKRREELASNKYHHVYLFDSEVSSTSVKACMTQLNLWERMGAAALTVDLVINSPGGSVFDGFALMDYIEGMHARGHTVNTSVLGMAASMGGVLLQVGKERRMGASAMLLIHEASFGAGGSFGKVEDQVKLVQKMQDRILDLYAKRAKEAKGSKAMTRIQIKNKWRRTDWWINATESLAAGFVDKVL